MMAGDVSEEHCDEIQRRYDINPVIGVFTDSLEDPL